MKSCALALLIVTLFCGAQATFTPSVRLNLLKGRLTTSNCLLEHYYKKSTDINEALPEKLLKIGLEIRDKMDDFAKVYKPKIDEQKKLITSLFNNESIPYRYSFKPCLDQVRAFELDLIKNRVDVTNCLNAKVTEGQVDVPKVDEIALPTFNKIQDIVDSMEKCRVEVETKSSSDCVDSIRAQVIETEGEVLVKKAELLKVSLRIFTLPVKLKSCGIQYPYLKLKIKSKVLGQTDKCIKKVHEYHNTF